MLDYDEEDQISERSYYILHTWENITEKFLAFTISLKWLFASACINFALYVIESYQIAFDETFKDHLVVYIALFVCNVFSFIDIYSTLMRHYMKFPNKKFVYQKYHKAFIFLDVISVYTIIVEVLNVNNREVVMVKLFFLAVRNHKIPLYHIRVSNTDRIETLAIFMSKYVLIYALILHTFTCLFYKSCLCTQNDYPENTFFNGFIFSYIKKRNYSLYNKGLREYKDFTPCELYAMILFFIMGSVTNIGYARQRNDTEIFIAILVMVVSFIVNFILIGDLSSIKLENQYDKASFANRLRLIKLYMGNERFTPKTRKRISNYYLKFWKRTSSHNTKFQLDIIPPAMHTELKLDSYWFAIHQSFVLKDESLATKRRIANIMETEHFNKGDFITDIVGIKSKLFFIAQGSVKILSLEDNESSLLSLGVGTSFGNTSLVYSYVDKCSVVAECYCILHTLEKSKFWYLKELQCFRECSKTFKTVLKRVEEAKAAKLNRVIVDEEKALNRVKKSLKDVGIYNIYDERNICQVGRHLGKFDCYIRSQRIDSHFDNLFIRTIWPWRLKNNTSLTGIWEFIIIFSTCILVIIWPLHIYFYIDLTSTAVHFMCIYFGTLFILDVIIQISTAVETSTGLRIQYSEILDVRCSSWTFLFDIISAIPFELLMTVVYFDDKGVEKISKILILSLKLLKVSRISKYVKKMEIKYVNVNMAIFKSVKHILIVLTLTYIVGLLYYLTICFNGPTKCKIGSTIKNIALDSIKIEQDASIRLIYTCFFSLMFITQNTLFFKGTIHEIYFVLIFSIVGLYFFQFALSDISTITILSKSVWNNHYIKIINTQRYMILRKFNVQMRSRILHYLETQWVYDCGLRNRDMFFDLPKYLYNEQQSLYYLALCKEVPLFNILESEALRLVASRCKTIFLPPGEIIVYKGAMVSDMYIIDEGSCEIVSEIGGKTKRIISSKDHFCSLNMLFELPLAFDVKTITHVSLVKISRADCIYALKMNPSNYSVINTLIGESKREINVPGRFYVTHLKSRRHSYVNVETHYTAKSWRVFEQSENNDIIYLDYLQQFKKSSFLTLFKYVSMRRTMMPNGSFCYYWELFRTLCVWITCLVNPVSFVYEVYFPNIRICTSILSLIFIIDIYLQMHLCYYTPTGLEVTHPIYTSIHYIKRYFLFDVIGLLPLDHPFIYLMFEIKPKVAVKYSAIASFLKYTMIIRSRCLFHRAKIFKKQSLWLSFAYAMMIFTSMYNIVASIYMLFTGEFYKYKNNVYTVRPVYDSWIFESGIKKDLDPLKPIYFYATCLKMASSNILLLGYMCNDNQLDVNEKILSSLAGIIGYLIAFTFVLTDPWDPVVSTFFNSRKDLMFFLKNNQISKNITNRVINYINYLWRYTLFIGSKDLKYLPDTIQQDIVICVYGSTLKEISAFKNMGAQFIRSLGLNFHELYILAEMDIILINDIVDKIYIVHRGVVEVLAVDGTTLQMMAKGSMFGNVDNVSMTRSMVRVRAVNNVELIVKKTTDFYSLFSGHQDVINRMKNCILENNLSYIPSRLEHIRSMGVTKTKFENFIELINNKKTRNGYEFILYVINYLFVSYYLTFPYALLVHIVLYLTDMLMCINIALNVSHAVLEAKRKKRKKMPWYIYKYFIMDAISVIPFEIVPWILVQYSEIYFMAHANRLLRLVHVVNFFGTIGRKIDKRFYRMKILLLICFVIITVHSGACLFYKTAQVTRNLLLEVNWLKYNMCEEVHYFCAIYYSLTTFTMRGHRTIYPMSICDTIIHLFFATACKFMLAKFTGNFLSLLSHYRFGVTKFNNRVTSLHNALIRSNVSTKIIENVLDYTHKIWVQNRGSHIPLLLDHVPDTMLSEIKMEIFGKHLFLHPIFGECHVDFLRQLAGKIKLYHYFPTDVICNRGDINSTIYFIQSGVVEVVDILKSVEIVIDVLQANDSFGMLQGLLECTEHLHTFRATHVTNILCLEYKDWSYLLKFFPATKFSIYHDIVERIEKTQK